MRLVQLSTRLRRFLLKVEGRRFLFSRNLYLTGFSALPSMRRCKKLGS